MRIWHETIQAGGREPFQIIVSEKEAGFPAHWHGEIELVYVMEGHLEIEVEGERSTLGPQDILLIGSCQAHRYFPNPEGCLKIIAQLGRPLFGECAEHLFGRRFAAPLLKPAGPGSPERSGALQERSGALQEQLPGCAPEKRLPALHAALEKQLLALKREREEEAAGWALAVKARVHDLAAWLVRQAETVPGPAETYIRRLERLERLDPVLRYVEEHYESEITLEAAAARAGFSAYHFSRMFKEATGSTFTGYLQTFRVHMVMKLLEDRRLTVTEAAYAAGFGSVETFNRVFKRTAGCTPSEYRSKN